MLGRGVISFLKSSSKGKAFVSGITTELEKGGFDVIMANPRWDTGIDFIAKSKDVTLLIQAKNTKFVDTFDVMQLKSSAAKFQSMEPSSHAVGIVVSSGTVTHSASQLGHEMGIYAMGGLQQA
jgi:type I restriction-modification system DNA methylase subunit